MDESVVAINGKRAQTSHVKSGARKIVNSRGNGNTNDEFSGIDKTTFQEENVKNEVNNSVRHTTKLYGS